MYNYSLKPIFALAKKTGFDFIIVHFCIHRKTVYNTIQDINFCMAENRF